MKCDECGGRGWDLFERSDTGMVEIERCDACEVFEDDQAALREAYELFLLADDLRQVVADLEDVVALYRGTLIPEVEKLRAEMVRLEEQLGIVGDFV